MSADLAGIGDPVVVFTFGRSGTHMTIDLIRRHFASFASWKYPGELNSGVYTWLDTLTDSAQAIRALRRLRRPTRPTLMTHFWPDMMAVLGRDQPEVQRWLAECGRIIHVVRNPKHAISSAWPIENERARRGLQAVPDLEDYVERAATRWVADFEAMENDRRCLMLRFEDLLREPMRGVEKIGHHLGETPVWREPLLSTPHRTVTSARLSRLFRIHPVSTASVASRAVKRRYKLRWTSRLDAILNAVAGDRIEQLGYARSYLEPLRDDGDVRLDASDSIPQRKFVIAH